jgi:hypothetical protein
MHQVLAYADDINTVVESIVTIQKNPYLHSERPVIYRLSHGMEILLLLGPVYAS